MSIQGRAAMELLDADLLEVGTVKNAVEAVTIVTEALRDDATRRIMSAIDDWNAKSTGESVIPPYLLVNAVLGRQQDDED